MRDAPLTMGAGPCQLAPSGSTAVALVLGFTSWATEVVGTDRVQSMFLCASGPLTGGPSRTLTQREGFEKNITHHHARHATRKRPDFCGF